MNIKKLFILVLVISIIFSVAVVSAAGNETTHDIVTNTNELEIIEINNENIEMENKENQEMLSDNIDSIEIYVGENKTTDGGNGSYYNPYSTLELACQNVNGENKATINIFNGTYYLGSLLKFNTRINNLLIFFTNY